MPIINESKCIGCKICVNICPVDAISMKDGKAFIDQETCIHCGKCLHICPVNAIEHGGRHGHGHDNNHHEKNNPGK